MKKQYCFVFFLFVLLGVYAQSDIGFSWQLGFFTMRASALELQPVSKILQLADGDHVKVSLASKDNPFCYIVDEQPDGIVYELYNRKLDASRQVLLPGDSPEDSYTLGPPDGIDKFHIILSSSQCRKLEQLLSILNKESNSADASGKVLDEIAKIRQSVSSVVETPSKPAVMGATTRALSQNSSTGNLVDFSGSTVYVKTIRLRH